MKVMITVDIPVSGKCEECGYHGQDCCDLFLEYVVAGRCESCKQAANLYNSMKNYFIHQESEIDRDEIHVIDQNIYH